MVKTSLGKRSSERWTGALGSRTTITGGEREVSSSEFIGPDQKTVCRFVDQKKLGGLCDKTL